MRIDAQTTSRQKFNNAEVQTRFQLISTSQSCGHQSYVPFLGKQNRFHINKHSIVNPPIGAYNLPSCFNRTKSYIQERVNKFLQESDKKKQQMSIFKSSINRFSKVKKDIPGPASYNLFQKQSGSKQIKIRCSMNSQSKQKKITDLARTCPSIPNKQNKYGYSVDHGAINKIQKDDQTIRKELESRKQYLATLDEQTIMRDTYFGHSHHQKDQKKILYGQTQKVVANHVQSEKQFSKTLLGFKKPKHEHLYNSKGIEPSTYHQELGPGKYDVKSQAFSLENKKQKYQFFGSTEVRFRQKQSCAEKGYSLIEIVKENKKNAFKDIRNNPPRKSYEAKQNKVPQDVLPGPGQYNPKDETLKKSRGNAFFPQSQRFQGVYAKPEQMYHGQDDEQQAEKKNGKVGKLKKQRFKPLQKVYNPVSSSHICGILSQNKGAGRKQSKKHTNIEKRLELVEKNEIKCWSRQGNRQQICTGNEYMKELKEELAFINDTPRADQVKTKQMNRNKNQTKA